LKFPITSLKTVGLKYYRLHLLTLTALFLAVVHTGFAFASGGVSLPFKPGERLTYDVTWMGVLGGEGVLSVGGEIDYNGHQVYVLKSVARSIGFVRKLYKVDDHTKSFFDVNKLVSHRVEINISEGNYRKKKIIEFDQQKGVASYFINDKEPEIFEIDQKSQDSFSSLYAIRALGAKLTVGNPLFIPVFEDKKKYTLKVNVARRERLSLPQGLVDTVVLEPQLKTEGIFLRKGKMTIWLTDDESLTPVVIRSKILIGAFYATLRSYEGVKINFIPYKKQDAHDEQDASDKQGAYDKRGEKK